MVLQKKYTRGFPHSSLSRSRRAIQLLLRQRAANGRCVALYWNERIDSQNTSARQTYCAVMPGLSLLTAEHVTSFVPISPFSRVLMMVRRDELIEAVDWCMGIEVSSLWALPVRAHPAARALHGAPSSCQSPFQPPWRRLRKGTKYTHSRTHVYVCLCLPTYRRE